MNPKRVDRIFMHTLCIVWKLHANVVWDVSWSLAHQQPTQLEFANNHPCNYLRKNGNQRKNWNNDYTRKERKNVHVASWLHKPIHHLCHHSRAFFLSQEKNVYYKERCNHNAWWSQLYACVSQLTIFRAPFGACYCASTQHVSFQPISPFFNYSSVQHIPTLKNKKTEHVAPCHKNGLCNQAWKQWNNLHHVMHDMHMCHPKSFCFSAMSSVLCLPSHVLPIYTAKAIAWNSLKWWGKKTRCSARYEKNVMRRFMMYQMWRSLL